MVQPSPATPRPRVVDLRAGRRRDGVRWVDGPAPVLSWRTADGPPGWVQSRAELRVTWLDDGGSTGTATASGPVSTGIAWPWRPLRSRERVRIEVVTAAVDGPASAGAAVEVEAPLLDAADWTASWIALPTGEDTPGQLRRCFTLPAAPVRARLHVTALGALEVELNGVRVGDEVLAPGWTAYHDRVLASTHDVTDLLRAGTNVVGAWLAGAWFTERYGFFGRARRAYDGPPALLAQLEVDLVDGTRVVVGTDGTWTGTTEGPLRASGIYAGEEFDATRHDPAWSRPGPAGDGWAPVRVLPAPSAVVLPATAEPVRRTQLVTPVALTTSPSGAQQVDFGQNLVGRVRIRVTGPAGHTVTLRHAEVLEDGELATRQLRHAYSVDRYTLAGTGVEEWEPRFTFHGFRYLQVDDWPGELTAADVTAVVCHSDMAPTASFSCSEPLLERLHENVAWSMRGNFLSIPTDCPQRDERLGWTGDLQVFAGAAATLHDCDAFLTSWLADLAAEQRRSGGVVPIIVPTAMPEDREGVVAAWGDAATVVPWTLHERFGDVDVLARQWASMQAWVEVELAQADEEGLWSRGYQLGDWLDPRAPAHSPREGRTHPSLVASAYLFRSLDVVARTARVLGQDADADRYAGLAERTRTAFLAAYVTPAGRMVSAGPTTYAMTLVFGIATDPLLRERLGRRLAEVVREDGYRIGTGFVGTPLVMDALCATGQLHTAGRLLLQTESPSWLYPVTVGATTVWERWDALLPDGTVNPHEMTSFNHYALGAVVDWLHRGLVGIAPAEPGYRRVRVAPVVLPGLTSATSDLVTPYGPVHAGWVLADGAVRVTAHIPTGAGADVLLPDGTTDQVGSGEHSWTVPWAPPVPTPQLAGLDTDLAELVDDPEALALVRSRVAAFDPGRARAFDGPLRYEAGSTLRTALMFADPAGLQQVDQALLDLAAHRTTPTEETP
ncbi:alpha-L-rhamnosidase [Klenkia soli]|uniref:alpha-L-rhamnosidase n=1 Tax=Klenkia soli TaxID=1052260 RepID=A0A1H0LQJ0_9ACTN|nr:alpha-L-rhamnosidase [Klenkia soli]SDO70343.1 alpha-L-rhamnosidase [Klenkia soli]